jgi:hypothetical protein
VATLLIGHTLHDILRQNKKDVDVLVEEVERRLEIWGLSKGDKGSLGAYVTAAHKQARVPSFGFALECHQEGGIRYHQFLGRIRSLEETIRGLHEEAMRARSEIANLERFLDADYTFLLLREANGKCESVLRDKIAHERILKEVIAGKDKVIAEKDAEIQRLKGRLKRKRLSRSSRRQAPK